MKFSFNTPKETAKDLSRKLKDLRLLKKWKRSTLARRSGVTESSLRRFEQTGQVSLNNFLKLLHALGRLDETENLLKLPTVQSLEELKIMELEISKRGSI
ncbi:MAG: helix-turn-helix domain-containing protein [Desulfobacula sp.]|nr:helix-turn-helix domain-containing protein [Desulfobacula sp.]